MYGCTHYAFAITALQDTSSGIAIGRFKSDDKKGRPCLEDNENGQASLSAEGSRVSISRLLLVAGKRIISLNMAVGTEPRRVPND